MSVEELLAKASKKCETFSNPIRTFIATFIAVKEEVTWTELKTILKKRAGAINPNTLSFHLGELANAGFIEKVNIKGQPRYRIAEKKLPDLQRLVGEDLLRAVREKF